MKKFCVFIFLKGSGLRSKCTQSQTQTKCTGDQETLMAEKKKQDLLEYVQIKSSHFLGRAVSALASIS